MRRGVKVKKGQEQDGSTSTEHLIGLSVTDGVPAGLQLPPLSLPLRRRAVGG